MLKFEIIDIPTVKAFHYTDDVIIADIDASSAPYYADPTGNSDSSDAIQAALDECAKLRGGTVWLPCGYYRITKTISIPSFVTLRGDFCPDAANCNEPGTVICADVESIDSNLPALINLGGSGGVLGLTIYYPNQDLSDVKPYPCVFYADGIGDRYMLQTIKNVTVINGYRGIAACTDNNNAHEMLTIDNFRGTFLYCAAEAYNQADVGTWMNVDISPAYWALYKGKVSSPVPSYSEIEKYTKANTTAFILGDLEWTEFLSLSVSGCRTAVNIVKGKRIEFAGSIAGLYISNCTDGVIIDSIDERWGMVIAEANIKADNFAVKNNTAGTVKISGLFSSGSLTGVTLSDNEIPGLRELIKNRPVYTKPADRVITADFNKETDITEILNLLLTEAGKTGGVVYVPAGIYYLGGAIKVPAGVELRGSSSTAQRDQGGNSGGTVLLTSFGAGSKNPEEDEAAITLGGENSGINGIRVVYHKNSPHDINPYPYCIRGKASGVYCVNCSISAGYYGIDFKSCDRHIISRFVTCCYKNAISAGGKNGYIEGCLQNGTVISRNGLQLENWLLGDDVFKVLFDPVTRLKSTLIHLCDSENEVITNTFAYGVKTLICSEKSKNVSAINIGADNIGLNEPMIEITSGSFGAINVMRYNGIWYKSSGAEIKIINTIAILEKSEDIIL